MPASLLSCPALTGSVSLFRARMRMRTTPGCMSLQQEQPWSWWPLGHAIRTDVCEAWGERCFSPVKTAEGNTQFGYQMSPALGFFP